MLKYVRYDFNRTKQALNDLVGIKVPLGIFILYYIVMIPIGMLLAGVALLYIKIMFYRLAKEMGEITE